MLKSAQPQAAARVRIGKRECGRDECVGGRCAREVLGVQERV
jgi:hypothetical protein